MGKMSDSFSRELGKNAGKAVSNWVFGDAHATPYRRVGGTGRSGGGCYKSQRQINAEHLEAQRQSELEHYENMRRLEQRIVQDEYEQRIVREQRIEQERIQREALQEQGKYEAALKEQIESQLRTVRKMTFENSEHAYRQLADLATDMDLLHWDLKCATTNKKTLELNASLCDEYFDQYCHCLTLSLERLSDREKLFHKKNLLFAEKRKAYAKGFMSGAKMLTSRIFNVSTQVNKLVERLTVEANEQVSETLEVPQIEREPVEGTHQTIEHVENRPSPRPLDESVATMPNFIDLNQAGRIEKRLTEIWDKYRKIIGLIADRKPIFVSDCPQGSVLFVGVNPSYFEGDDQVLIHSQDDRSLYYQSLYGEEQQPQYFQLLDAFTKEIDPQLPYAQMNLLYAREDDRAHLLSLDHNFIREQLELTYDNIVRVEPKVVLFFSKFCKDLIFGQERWVDPASRCLETESFVLNGTTIPVLFTEDIHSLNQTDLALLECKLKSLLGVS